MSLGCPQGYSVMVVRQPGNMTGQGDTPVVWGELTEILSLRWGRILSGTVTATVAISKCPRNCELFVTADPASADIGAPIGIRPWAFELWFYRDGIRAFEGPIVYIRETLTQFIIDVRDMTQWVAQREIILPYTFTSDAATIAKNLVDTFFPTTDPLLLQYCQQLGTAEGSLTVSYDNAQYNILQKWNDLIAVGLSFTTYSRHLLIFGQTPPNINTPFLLDADKILGECEIIQDGIDFGVHVVCLGEGFGLGMGPSLSDSQFYGKVTYPPIRMNNVLTYAELTPLTQAFYDRKRDLSPELVVPQGSALAADTEIFNTGYTLQTQDAIALPDLICGYRYDLQVKAPFCQPGRYPMRLGELQVTWTPDQGERIMVSFTSLAVPPEEG